MTRHTTENRSSIVSQTKEGSSSSSLCTPPGGRGLESLVGLVVHGCCVVHVVVPLLCIGWLWSWSKSHLMLVAVVFMLLENISLLYTLYSPTRWRTSHSSRTRCWVAVWLPHACHAGREPANARRSVKQSIGNLGGAVGNYNTGNREILHLASRFVTQPWGIPVVVGAGWTAPLEIPRLRFHSHDASPSFDNLKWHCHWQPLCRKNDFSR